MSNAKLPSQAARTPMMQQYLRPETQQPIPACAGASE